MLRMHWSRQLPESAVQLQVWSCHKHLPDGIYLFPANWLAAVIHLHASDCIRYNAQQSDLSFGALDKSMHLGRQL